MGRVKEKDIQCIYDAISESAEIQELIKRIAAGNASHGSCVKASDSNEANALHEQLSSLRQQLKNTSDELDGYKAFCAKAKARLEDYERLKKEAEDLCNDISRYKSDLTQKALQIEELVNNIKALKTEKDNLSSELNAEKKVIDSLKNQFEAPMKYMKMYRSLSYSVKSGLENVICDKNVITFIASCSCEDNLSSVWEYAKDISSNSEGSDFIILSQIFDYFFDVFNESQPAPKYERDCVKLGDYLDDDAYNRCQGSAASGYITKVILRGYKSINTGKIIHKSLVKA